MEDLLKIAQETMADFNPATDTVDTFEEVPDGEYSCLLEEVTAKNSKEKGTDWICLKFSILNNEEFKNNYIWVNYFFTEKTTQRSIKALTKLAYEFGYDLPLESFTSLETLAETLNGMSGNQAEVSKKTSNSGFANYKVTPTV